MSPPLDPEELRRLLAEAVEPIEPHPRAYARIRAGTGRRRRWRGPLAAAGALALAAVVGLLFVTLRPVGPAQEVTAPAAPSSGRATTPAPTPPSAAALPPAHAPPRRPTPAPRTTSPGAGGGTSTRPAPTGPSPTAVPTPSRTPVVPTTPVATTTPAAVVPVRTPALDGDVDGDGKVDALTYAGGDVVATLTRLGVERVPLAVATTPTLVVTDIDHDGYGEVLVRTDVDASTARYAVLRLVRGVMTAMVGPPLPLLAGVSAMHGDGFRCTAQGTLVVVHADSTDGVTYTGTSTTYRLVGTGFAAGTPTATTISATTTPSPFAARCG